MKHAYLLSVIAASVSGCSSTPPEPDKPLPFVVAVIPIEESRIRETKETNQDGMTDMRLNPDLQELTTELVSALDGRTFTRATLLQMDPGELAAGTNGVDKQSLWVEKARAAHADLILACDFEYAPAVRGEPNGNFWLNMPLFLLGGPFCYFVKDRTYHADVELSGAFYDPKVIDNEETSLGDIAARALSTNARFQSIDMNFLDRAGSNGGKYAASLLIPSGFLSKEGKSVKDQICVEVVKSLSRELAKNVQSKREELLRDGFLAPFYLDSDDVTIRRQPDGKVSFQAMAYLRRGESVERLDTYRLRAGARSSEGDFANVKPTEEVLRGSRYIQYPIRGEVAADSDTHEVCLELEAGATQRFVRTYTFAIP